VLKKCVKLPDLAHHLVKESGLLLWLSSVMSIFSGGSDGTESSCSRVTELTLEVKHLSYFLLYCMPLQKGKTNKAHDLSSFSMSLHCNWELINCFMEVLLMTMRTITSLFCAENCFRYCLVYYIGHTDRFFFLH
jgi:hypothetical protein